jgi:hypothetical protein
MIEYGNIITAQNHEVEILKIINDHFDLAEERLEEIYVSHFANTKAVLGRHWRHKKDIPSDLMALPKHAYGSLAKIYSKKVQIKEIPKTGKVCEVEKIIAEKLLDLQGLEKKIEQYVQPYQDEFTSILEQVPALQREKFLKELEIQVARLQTPTDGAKEAVVFIIVGLIGKVFGDKITFGSSMATGHAVALSIYMSQLSWFGSLWYSIFGAPAWVAYAGMGAGMLVVIVISPFLTPLFELAINCMRARKILKKSIAVARHKLTASDNDCFDIAGKTAIYLQVLPDIITAAKWAAKTVSAI